MEELVRRIKNFVKFKSFLYPIRKLAGRFVIIEKYENLSSINLAVNYVCSQQVEGDYLEFGVFRGWKFVEAYRSFVKAIDRWGKAFNTDVETQKKKMRFFAFDSFCGLPKVSGIDENAGFHEGRYNCSQEKFLEYLKESKTPPPYVDLSRVVIVPGFFEETLTDDLKKKHNMKSASVILIDCDLYSSTIPVLNFITDLLVNGTILIIDEWYHFKSNPSAGQQQAVNEWLQRNPQIHLTPYMRSGLTQQSFIVTVH